MKVLFVHGIGFHETGSALAKWSKAWSDAILNSCTEAGVDFSFSNPLGADGKPGGNDPGILYYEHIIKGRKAPSGFDYLQTVSSLLKSYVTTKIGDLFNRERGLLDDEMKWKAREIAAWAHDDQLRATLRKHVAKEIRSKNPDVVIAHSYGGLITYDACLFEDPDLLKDRYFVTLETQIGNALLRREFGGRQLPVKAKHWFNLYNPGDPVFVVPLDHIRAENFTHLEVKHQKGHDGAAYLGARIVADKVWRSIADGRKWLDVSRGVRSLEKQAMHTARNRALLVGIDEYESPEVPPLKGCVNDTYQLSAVLQECGMAPHSIRMLHNARATKENLLAQIAWLLEDARPGDHRFLSFSGHGHQMASYDAEGRPDELEEILVTHDYAFTQTTGLRDRDFQDLYAHLPRDVHFLIFLDCCHSGGLTRASGPLVRSFTGPADIEHECMRWNAELQMWEQVGLAGSKGLNEKFLPGNYKTKAEREKEYLLYYGANHDMRRIGRATQLRDLPHDKFDRLAATLRKLHPGMEAGGLTGGPYLPLVFMACGQDEKACEYVHGSVSYGAFTYAMAQALRDTTRKGAKPLTYQQLLGAAAAKLTRLGYPQTPDILGNRRQLGTTTPFGAGKLKARAAKSPAKKAAKRVAKKATRGRA